MEIVSESTFFCFRVQIFGSKLLAICLCCFCATLLQAQVEILTDSNHVETGNPYLLHLRIPANLGQPDSLRFYAWGNVLPPENIAKQTEWQSDGQFLNATLTALFFDADTLQLPPLAVTFRNGDTLFTQPLQVIVQATPSPDDLNDMATIKDIHRESTLWTDYLPWILGGLGVMGLLFLLFWLAKRQKEAKILSRSIELPPHELALKKLEVLAQKQLTSKGFVKEHYAELTFILREFLEKRFGIPALESTTEETLFHLGNLEFSTEQSLALKNLLEQADLAKFAKIIPPESFHTAALETTKTIIQETAEILANEPNQP